MSRPRIVLSFVEDGWQSARTLSVALVRELGLDVRHVLKGAVATDVTAMITPYPGMRIIPVPRARFWVVARALLIAGCLRQRVRAVVVDNPRARHWAGRIVRPWRVPVIEAGEQFQQLVYRWNDESLDGASLLGRFRSTQQPCGWPSSSTARATIPAASISSGR